MHLINFDHRRSSTKLEVLEPRKGYSKWFVKYIVDLDAIALKFPEVRQNDELGSKIRNFYVLSLVRRRCGEKDILVLYVPSKGPLPGAAISYQLDDEEHSCQKLCYLSIQYGLKPDGQVLGGCVHQYIENPFLRVGDPFTLTLTHLSRPDSASTSHSAAGA